MPMHEPSTGIPLKVACIGGGPGGLFTAIALAQAYPGVDIDVFERDNKSDIFGFGVVFSDATLDNIDDADPILRQTLARHGRRWDTISVSSNGTVVRAGGNGMSAVHRRILLGALRNRATALGARLHFATPASIEELEANESYDLIVAADGSNSSVRQHFLTDLGHTVDEARVKFIWFATTYQFDGLTFLHERNEHGNFAVHAYPIGSDLSTFIVETDEATWRRAELDSFDPTTPPGPSDVNSQRYLENVFAVQLQGHQLVANNSRWANFRTRRTRHWLTRSAEGTPIAFVGDAVHTAHFSVGSGTKMAMEDGAALARSIAADPVNLPAALQRFEDIRRPQVASIQDAALPSLSWWDHFGEYQRRLEPWQFGFHFFTRAISAGKIGRRDPGLLADSVRAWRDHHGANPLETPLRLGDQVLGQRLLRIVAQDREAVTLTDGITAVTATTSGAEGRRTDLTLFSAAPVDSTALDADAVAALDRACAQRPPAVVVRGGTELARVLCCEYIRLNHDIPAVLIDQPSSVAARRAIGEGDNATTLVLSGRADAVAYEPDPVVAQSDSLSAEAVG